jgi:hypothetical protein
MPHWRLQRQNFHSSAARGPAFLSGESGLTVPGEMENGTSFGSTWDLRGLYVKPRSDSACVEHHTDQRLVAFCVPARHTDFGVPIASWGAAWSPPGLPYNRAIKRLQIKTKASCRTAYDAFSHAQLRIPNDACIPLHVITDSRPRHRTRKRSTQRSDRLARWPMAHRRCWC